MYCKDFIFALEFDSSCMIANAWKISKEHLCPPIRTKVLIGTSFSPIAIMEGCINHINDAFNLANSCLEKLCPSFGSNISDVFPTATLNVDGSPIVGKGNFS